jgi:hypothetical protein
VQVRAVTTAGGGAASNMMAGLPRTVPSDPTIAGVTSGNRGLSVAFTAPTSDGGTPVLGYRYSLDGGTTWSVDVVSSSSPLVLYGLENGFSYHVALLAVSIAGDGAASNVVTGTPAVAPVEVASGSGSAIPELTPGVAEAFFNGSPVTTTSEALGTGWSLTTPTAALSIDAYDKSSTLVPLAAGAASLEGYLGGSVLVQGEGFKPGTQADVWLFSTPILLGTPTVLPDGTFRVMLPIPQGTPVGQHTIQVNGLTASEETLSASLGVRIASARSTLASTGVDVELLPVALLIGFGVALLSAAQGRRRRALP